MIREDPPKETLWNAEIVLDREVPGPLVLGDGRFLGLGVMAPAKDLVPGRHVFAVVDGLVEPPEPLDIARALRRAVMARVQTVLGDRAELPRFFSGHEDDGTPARGARSAHLSFAFDPHARRLLIIAPHMVERRVPTRDELAHIRTLDSALIGLRELRAGRSGLLELASVPADDDDDAILGQAMAWTTSTPYVVTRHAHSGAAVEALVSDVRAQCHRAGLPTPRVESSDVQGVPGVGLSGTVTLHFERAVSGPILLGRTRHFGGGLFRIVAPPGRT